MRYRFSLLFCCLLAPAAHAFDTTTAFTAKSLYVTSKLTSTPFENKLLRDARGDAASFVASDGSIRGARLEAALRWLRVAHPELAASDQELAEAILAQEAITTVPENLHAP